MNIKTITFDADKWQLVPKDIHPISSGYGMSLMVHLVNPPKHPTVGSFDFYQLWWSQLIGAAPQPETLSPWMPIESAPRDGTPFLVNNLAFATHWMPLPQAPTALLGATGATAPEVE